MTDNATYPAQCDKCPLFIGNFGTKRDADNAITMHKNIAHKDDGAAETEERNGGQ